MRNDLLCKEDLFITEYIECRLNGAEAVRRVYNIGGKGGSRDPSASTARTMAAKLLAKDSVRARLKQRLGGNEIGIPFVLMSLQRLAESENSRIALKALDRLAAHLGMCTQPPPEWPH